MYLLVSQFPTVESPTDIEQAILRFLRSNFPLGQDAMTLAKDESLLEAGIIDSTGVLELIEFVENQFAVHVPDNDLLPENFDSVENIVRYLTTRVESGGGRSA